jgi:hypothetical protein
MQINDIIAKMVSKSVADAERIRAIAYSMDTLVPGFYVCLGSLTALQSLKLPQAACCP